MNISIGKSADGHAVTIDLVRLVDSRALVQANSGGGKSYFLRLIAEQSAGRVQTIILDPEGEFATLREKVDLLLVSREGEIQPTVRGAKLLARKVAELNVSAVIDLYDLRLPDRREFVRNFCESLLEIPRDQWHPMLVAIDECHLFAPERSAGDAVSTQAVIALASQGRKRGIGLISLTQRLSKLHKDAAAELNNVFVGRTWLPNDQERCGDLLGMTKAERGQLRDLDPGELHGFGPALSISGVVKFKVAQVQTTHPKAGERHQLQPPKPSKVIREIADALADLPKQAEEEIKNLQEAQQKIKQLERQLAQRPKEQVEKTVEKIVEVPVLKNGQLDRTEKIADRLQAFAEKFTAETAELRRLIAPAAAPRHAPQPTRPIHSAPRTAVMARPLPKRQQEPPKEIGDFAINKVQQRILNALAWYESLGFTEPTVTQVGAVALVDPTGGYFSNSVGPLSSAGLVQRGSGTLRLTDAGRAMAQTVEDVGSLAEYHDVLRARVRKMRSASNKTIEMLDAIISASGESLTTAQIGDAVGVDHTGGYFSNSIGPLGTVGLIERRQGMVTPTSVLFPAGLQVSHR